MAKLMKKTRGAKATPPAGNFIGINLTKISVPKLYQLPNKC
tara:strand:+ start:496 stop:618 length:123 start_codon:yes stop_codon:yes gene_type:complete